MALLTFSWALDGILILLSLVILFYFYMKRNHNYWKKRGIPHEPPTSIFGNFGPVVFLKRSPGDTLKTIYEKFDGEAFVGFYLLDKPALIIRDPELIKQVITKDFNFFPDRYASPSTNDRLGYANLFMIKNPGWKTLRAKLTPIYTSGKLKKMFELMRVVGDNLESYLENLTLDGKDHEVELKDLFARFTTDLITTTAFGLQVNSVENEDSIFRKYGKKVFHFDLRRCYELYSIFFAPHLVNVIGATFFGKDTTHFLRSAFWDALNQRMESKQKRNDLIDLLIDLREYNKGEKLEGFSFEDDDLLSQAAVFFTAGFEAASSTMSFTLYELALHPEMQEKVRNEIKDALEESGGKMSYDLVMNLPYLDMVVSEELRKYPPLPFLDRVTAADYHMPDSDLVVEKGTPIYVSMSGVHYNPEYFPDPERFDPDRFSEENKKNRPSCTYFPFGEGPHTCIGMRTGLLQAKLGLVYFLKKWEVTPSAKTTVPLRFGATLITQTRDGIYLNIRKISSAGG